MKQVLVAIDGCPHSKEIVDRAIDIAKSTSAKFLLVHVMERERVPDAYRDTHGDSLPEHYYDVIFERNTSDVVAKIRKAGILFEAIPGIGSPTKFITETAKSKRPDYIVIGMHGLHNIGKVRALGGVARRVLEEATVPVMAVPGTGKTRAA